MIDRKLNILFLTARFPYPIIGGDRLKPFFILKYLATNHNVTLITFYQGQRPKQNYIDVLTGLGLDLHLIPLDPIKAALRTAVLTFFGGFPLEIGYYNQPEFGFEVAKVLRRKKFDLGFSFFMRTAEYLKKEQIKKILMAEDCRTLYQKRSYQESSNFVQKLIRWWEYIKLQKYEPAVMNYFDKVTFVTNDDIDSITKMNSNAKYGLLSNGVDIEKFHLPGVNINRHGILFTGKLDVWANVLMVQSIINDIFPIIKSEIPDATLKIVGANPPKIVKDLINGDITLTSDVPEMFPYLQNAEVFIHPHSGGTGIQNKLLEAMSCGCPVVTTPTGIQGIPVIDGKSVLIGRDNKDLANNTIRLLKNKDLAYEIGMNGRFVIENNLSWEAIYRQLDSIIEEVAG